MTIHVSVFAVLLASACTLNGRTMGSGGSYQPTAAPTTPHDPASRGVPPPPPRDDSEPVYHMDHGPNFVGMTIPEARAAAAKFGWSGEIEILEQQPYDASCKAGTVCRSWPDSDEFKVKGMLQFFVNPTVTISAPPPQ